MTQAFYETLPSLFGVLHVDDVSEANGRETRSDHVTRNA